MIGGIKGSDVISVGLAFAINLGRRIVYCLLIERDKL
jgi:hypothetical protein